MGPSLDTDKNCPYANRLSYSFIFQGEAGLVSVTGEPENNGHGGPQKVGVAVSDLITGPMRTLLFWRHYRLAH